MNKKFFFGWENIRWFITEVGKIYSGKSGFFSKKRIESGVAFIIGQWGMIYFLLANNNEMSAADIAIWAGIEFAMAGYMVQQIQREKITENESSDTSTPPSEDDTTLNS